MRSSYLEEDVVLLLKDITGLVQPQSTEERERLIQSGRHYSEMLPIEYVPTEKYMAVYREALNRYAKQVADAVGVLSHKIMAARGRDVVLVSLARAGTPIGILIRRYIKLKYKADVPHYSISIIRGRGIDDNAMKYLLDRYRPQQLLFVDGWIGKGAILAELEKDIMAYPQVSPEIAVLADPAGVTELCGTHEDILIPSSCLNSTVSGLVSRTFLREDIIGKEDFHGAVYYGELKNSDLSYEFIETIEKNFYPEILKEDTQKENAGLIGKKNDTIEVTAKSEGRESGKTGELLDSKGKEPGKTRVLLDLKGKEPGKTRVLLDLKGKEPGKTRVLLDLKGKEPGKTRGLLDLEDKESGKVQEVTGPEEKGIDEVRRIAAFFEIGDINFIKPGIGETTRVLLRRIPWKILIDERYREDPELGHVVRLAEEKHVPVEYYKLSHYKCCGIIKKIADA